MSGDNGGPAGRAPHAGRALHEEPESLGDALDRIVDASHAVVADQVRLAVLETQAVLARAIEAAGIVFVAAVCFSIAWTAAMVACYLWIRVWVPAPASALVPAAISVAAAVVAARASARRLRRRD